MPDDTHGEGSGFLSPRKRAPNPIRHFSPRVSAIGRCYLHGGGSADIQLSRLLPRREKVPEGG